jgi:hypothetical protein
MSEHDDRQDHDAKADELERELDEMEERSEKLGDDIGDAGEDWERRKADESVPGATGEPSEGDEDDGDGAADGEELDFGRALAEEGGDADGEDEG